MGKHVKRSVFQKSGGQNQARLKSVSSCGLFDRKTAQIVGNHRIFCVLAYNLMFLPAFFAKNVTFLEYSRFIFRNYSDSLLCKLYHPILLKNWWDVTSNKLSSLQKKKMNYTHRKSRDINEVLQIPRDMTPKLIHAEGKFKMAWVLQKRCKTNTLY